MEMATAPLTEGVVPTPAHFASPDFGEAGYYLFSQWNGKPRGTKSRPYKLADLQDGTLDKILGELAGEDMGHTRSQKQAEVRAEQRRRKVKAGELLSDDELAAELGL
jgi:hypothetical protein